MADDNGLYAKIVEDMGDTFEADSRGATAEQNPLLQKLKGAITKAVQTKVDYILQDVQKFSDHAKLYLYLQLPSGPSSGEKNLNLASLSSAEHMHACTWIRNHLEEYPDTCLPKQDVYDAYKRYCDNLCSRSLSAANFGKIIREIFPNIKARRLGGRGQSKYCYSGIRRKTVVNMPPLPSLDLKETETPERADLVQSYSDDVMDAACALTCDWAEKILKRSFNNIVEVAQFLIQQHIISSRSAHADLVMAMVVSEGGESHKEKHPAPGAKKTETEAPENAAKTQPQVKKETSPKPSAAPARSEAKKSSDTPAKQANSPQVNALVARLPFLLPRSPMQPVVVSPAGSTIHSSAPVLAPKLTPAGSTVKMALSVGPTSSPLPLNLAPVVNGPSGLISPPGSVPIINMILPSVTVPPAAEIPSKPKTVPAGRGVNGCKAAQGPQEPPKVKTPSKRPAESSSETGVVKRKRGRPRKKPEEPEKSAAGKTDGEDETDIIVVTVGYGDPAASPSSQEESSDVEVVSTGDGRRDPAGAGPSAASGNVDDAATKASTPSSQVSVIKGRTSSVHTGSGSPASGSGSREAAPAGHDVALPGNGGRTAVGEDSPKGKRRGSCESDRRPSDLSRGKSAPPPSKDHPDDSGLRASSVRLYRLDVDQGQAGETSGLSVTATQAPS